jgi:phage tail sheath protein FI
MATYNTPGVYVEEISTMPPSVAEVETAIPAFIGFTQKGPLLTPLRITSLVDYQLYFGSADLEKESLTPNIDPETEQIVVDFDQQKASRSVMYYAMQLYFGNGGGPCYIVSIGDFNSNRNGAKLKSYTDALDIVAKEDEPTLLVFPDAPFSLGADDYYNLMNAAIAQCTRLGDRFTIVDVLYQPDANNNDPLVSVDKFKGKIGSADAQLKYSAAYFPYLNTNIHISYDDSIIAGDTAGVLTKLQQDAKNLRDAANAAKDKLTQAENDPNRANEVQGLRTAFERADGKAKTAEEKLAQASGPALNSLVANQIKQAIDKLGITLTPCAAIAGVYASVDYQRGVWKAPANVTLNYVKQTTLRITDEEHGRMNIDVEAGKSVNAIRFFTGKGIMVWGARTLDGNSNEWRFISVRRFFNMVEESVKKSTGWAVFEPNDRNTWVKVRAMIENYLMLKWKDGALAGAKPEDAYFVRVGLGETMTSQDILEGRMIIEIGMAAVRPAEFIILKFSHKMQTS